HVWHEIRREVVGENEDNVWLLDLRLRCTGKTQKGYRLYGKEGANEDTQPKRTTHGRPFPNFRAGQKSGSVVAIPMPVRRRMARSSRTLAQDLRQSSERSFRVGYTSYPSGGRNYRSLKLRQ